MTYNPMLQPVVVYGQEPKVYCQEQSGPFLMPVCFCSASSLLSSTVQGQPVKRSRIGIDETWPQTNLDDSSLRLSPLVTLAYVKLTVKAK